jgi:WhiB family redox-sensing transcriptional regulator
LSIVFTERPSALTVSCDFRHVRCRDVNPELFFSPESERGVRKRAREMVAKSLCGTCPVQPECRQHALSVGEPYGVWGGTTESERDNDVVLAEHRKSA